MSYRSVELRNFRSLEDIEFISIINNYFSLERSDRRVNLQGYYLLPKFIDAHCHAVNESLRAGWFDLSSIKSKAELLRIISGFEGKFFLGYGWDESKWCDDKSFPTREELDKVTDKPVYLRRVDGHIAVVNTKASHLLRLSKEDFLDFARGIIAEGVLGKVEKILAKFVEPRSSKLREIARVHGISLFLDMGFTDFLPEAIEGIDVLFYVLISDPEDTNIGYLKKLSSFGIKVLGFKVIVDGSIGGRTAALFEPYRDDPQNKGKLLIDKDNLAEILKRANNLDLQVAIHAIGDRAIDVALSALKAGKKELRNRIEHFEMPHEDHIRKVGKLGVVASMQPNFVANWQCRGCLYDIRLGWERAKKMNPFRSVAERTVLAFGSDNMPFGPLYGIYGAMTHPLEEERLSFEEAAWCYTYGGAYSANIEESFGIRPNLRAEGNILTLKDIKSPNDLLKAKIIDLHEFLQQNLGGNSYI